MGKQIHDDLFFFSFLTWVRPRFDILSSKNKPDKVRKTQIYFSSDIRRLLYLIISHFHPQLVNFVSDLGGSLGLWIGMSVLSFAEVLELLLLITYALFRKLRRRLDGRIQSSSQSVRKAF